MTVEEMAKSCRAPSAAAEPRRFLLACAAFRPRG